MKYVSEFLSLRCATDIIGISYPVQRMPKEISEAMAMVRRVRSWALNDPNTYALVDLCSGNGLVPLLTAFTLPIKHNYAVDSKPRDREWDKVRKFSYIHGDIYSNHIQELIENAGDKVILTSCHACKNLASRVVELYQECKNVKKLVLMPCCVGKLPFNVSDDMLKQMGRDNLWALYLNQMAEGRLTKDDAAMSPKNRIIVASKDVNPDTTTEESSQGRILRKIAWSE